MDGKNHLYTSDATQFTLMQKSAPSNLKNSNSPPHTIYVPRNFSNPSIHNLGTKELQGRTEGGFQGFPDTPLDFSHQLKH